MECIESKSGEEEYGNLMKNLMENEIKFCFVVLSFYLKLAIYSLSLFL